MRGTCLAFVGARKITLQGYDGCDGQECALRRLLRHEALQQAATRQVHPAGMISGRVLAGIVRPWTPALRQIPGVNEVKQDREAIELHDAEAEPVVRELLARDLSLSGLEVTSAGLEEAFLALTQDNGKNRNDAN